MCFLLGWHEVFVAGIYHGQSKPLDVNQFLAAFVGDILTLRENGIDFKGGKIPVRIVGMSSDAPATCFVMNITNHGGYYGCRKCTTKGVWTQSAAATSRGRNGGRVTFPEIDAPLRTDYSFRQRIQSLHHKGSRSIVEDILSDTVADVILDYLHLVCIGSYKKLIFAWLQTPIGTKPPLTKNQITSISNYRLSVRCHVPSDFARKPRGIDELARWKATELRFDLLYLAPVEFKPYLSENCYKHFLLLHVGIRLLAQKSTCKLNADLADSFLRRFVKVCVELYGGEFISFNIHSLIHLAAEVKKHGSLDEMSAFPFENKLQIITNMVKESGRPLQQIVRRLEDENRVGNVMPVSKTGCHMFPIQCVRLEKNHVLGPLLPELSSSKQFKKLCFLNSYITTKIPDNCVFIRGGSPIVILIENIVQLYSHIYLIGRRYLKYSDLYTYPFVSSTLNEIVVSELSTTLESFQYNNVQFKAVHVPTAFPQAGSFYVSPLLNLDVTEYKI